MAIEITLNYSDAEYLSATKEKVEKMPNRTFHTYFPAVLLVVAAISLDYFSFLDAWWAITLVSLIAIYAIPSLFGSYLVPHIALLLARRKKLQDTYTFFIDAECIRRESESGAIAVKWCELVSIDSTAENFFFNLAKGSMLLPKARLTGEQEAQLGQWVEAVRESASMGAKAPG